MTKKIKSNVPNDKISLIKHISNEKILFNFLYPTLKSGKETDCTF